MGGMFQQDYGAKPQDMHCFMGGLNSFVEPPLIALDLPDDIRLDFLFGGQTLERMFAAGAPLPLPSLLLPQPLSRWTLALHRPLPHHEPSRLQHLRPPSQPST